MIRQGPFLIGILTGAGLMLLLGPARPGRERARPGGGKMAGSGQIEELVRSAGGKLPRDEDRVPDRPLRTRRRMDDVEDAMLVVRVRSALGRISSLARNIDVSAEHGRVTLRGVAPRSAMERLVDDVQSIPGVHDVINRLREEN
ncbi:MAG: BON domain-containing protein [Gemmatimonadota bacterium]|nr:BON domain-containing protein [Gemmatimonadota bacterium]